jgi:UDP-glucose 4-epimerase
MRIKDARQTFLGVWIRNLIHGKPLEVWGDGRQVRDFNFVHDVVDAMLLAILSDDANGEVYNLGGPERMNLRDLADLMVKTYGKGDFKVIPFPEDRKPIDIGDYFGDYKKIEQGLHWHPKTSLEEGLAKTLQYYSVHIEKYL